MSGVRKFAKIAMNLDAWTIAYVGGMITKPTSAHIQLIDKFVKTTKSILSAKADVFYLGNINNSNDSFRNLVKDAHHGTMQGSGLVWDNLVGFTNPQGTGWVDTNYNPSTQGIKYTLNDAGAGVNKFNAPSTAAYVFNAQGSTSALRCLNIDYVINDATNRTVSSIPFFDGFHFFKRISATQKSYVNQNILNQLDTQNSIALPNVNVILFRHSPAIAGFRYLGGLNCFYVGASLTDAEYATLNDSINEYLIACLFLKYGNDNWGVKMAKSYFYDLHGFEKYEAFEVHEFIKRHQPEYLSKDDPDYNRNNIIPYASSHFDTDGTAWWGVGSGTLSYNATDKCLQLNSTSTGFIWKTIATRYYNNFRVKFKFRSPTITLPLKVYIGNDVTPNTNPCSTNWQQYDSIINGAGGGTFYIQVRQAGILELDDIEVYEMFNMPELSLNSGAPGLTDWVDTIGDGLANGMSNGGYACTNSIVIGNGFTGNAQRAVENNTDNLACISIDSCVLNAGIQYLITGKYRSSTLFHIKHSVDGLIKEFPINGVASAIPFSALFTPTNTGNLLFLTGLATAGAWIEIDEVSTQVVNSIDDELGLNFGTSATTDWVDSNADGAADNIMVNLTSYAGIHSIVTGNGFIGNAQRVVENNASDKVYIFLSNAVLGNTLTAGKKYAISGKYRSNVSFSILNNPESIKYITLPVNTGNALNFSCSCVINVNGRFNLISEVALAGSWIEIDEISIKEVTLSGTELCVNTGNASTTDWVDTDGLADGWGINVSNSTPSIVTGNGFVGNAQRVYINSAGVGGHLYFNIPTRVGQVVKLSFKYRSNLTLAITNAFTIGYTIPINTGNATYMEIFGTLGGGVNIRFTFTNPVEGSFFEIDEVSIKEVTESDTVNFNKVLNGGFGLATDFVDSNADGLADNWQLGGVSNTNNFTNSIVTGNGFINNAQRIELKTNDHLRVCPNPNELLTIGKVYTFYCKYRSNVDIYLYSNLSGNVILRLPLNTGNCIPISTVFTSTSVDFYIGRISQSSGAYFEISEVLIIDNSNSQFYYNVFGPNGLNIPIADHIMLFKAGGNLLANAWTKSGALLRWNQDSSVTNSNTMPAYTRGSNLGIVTVTSTDGWNGVTGILCNNTLDSVNSFYGNFPRFLGTLKTGGAKCAQIFLFNNRWKMDIRNQPISSLANGIQLQMHSAILGYCRLNISDLVGGIYSGLVLAQGNLYNSNSAIIGDVTTLTTEIQHANTGNQYFILGYDLRIVGSLRNIIFTNNKISRIEFSYTNITEGLSVWNNNISIFSLSSSNLSTQAILDQLLIIKNQLAITPPIKNLTLNFSGASMGIVPANHQLILDIIAQHVAAGFTASISTRTS